ncbi:hypothetical protein GCM10022221_68220 [Actinocorallia aurea]
MSSPAISHENYARAVSEHLRAAGYRVETTTQYRCGCIGEITMTASRTDADGTLRTVRLDWASDRTGFPWRADNLDRYGPFALTPHEAEPGTLHSPDEVRAALDRVVLGELHQRPLGELLDLYRGAKDKAFGRILVAYIALGGVLPLAAAAITTLWSDR